MRLTVRMRLFLAFGFMTAVLMALGVYSIFSVRTVNEQSTIINTNWLPGIDRAHSTNTMTSDFRLKEYRHIIAADNLEMDQVEQEMESLNIEIGKKMAEYEETIADDVDRELFNIVKTEWDTYLQINKQVIDLSRQMKTEEAMKLIRGGSKEAFDNASNALIKLVKHNQTNADKADKEGNRIYDNTVKILIIVIVLGALIAVGVSFVITNGIIKPINKLASSANKMAEGDLDVEIDESSKDEIGVLAKSFSKMAANINEILTNINSSSEQVAAGSKQVSDSSMALSQGATEQASSIEQLTASIEEIASQTRQNAENANQANELAENAKINATQGNEQMKQMLKAMDEINDSSSRISKIIKVIDEIAFQTNILALNAAVEAARAGQHGKGFAVVAEEVRNLAARSANAAKETTDMIEGSIKKVEGGTKIANDTASALNSIVEGVAKVANLVGDIATASNEQASGIAQINQGVMQVSQVVQTNSATSEESAAASEELSSQAELLKEQVSRFKLKRSQHPSSSYKGMQGINPEVLRMLENMSQNKKANADSGDKGYLEAAATSSKTIALSDKEFGKY